MMNEWCHMTVWLFFRPFVFCEPRDRSLTVFHWPFFFVSRPIWTLGLGVRRKNCKYTLSPYPFLTPFRTKSQSRKAVWNADSLKARPCNFLLTGEYCSGASWAWRVPCSPPRNFLSAVFSQIESSFHLESSSNSCLLSVSFCDLQSSRWCA